MPFWSEPTDSVYDHGYADRRRSGRTQFMFPLRATIYPEVSGSNDTLRVTHLLAHDLSAGGISLICGMRIREGQRIELEMPDRVRLVVVHHVASMDNSRYLVGCQFCDTDQPATIA